MVNRELACDDGGGAAVAVFEDFQQVAALWGGEDGKAPIVDDRHVHLGDGFEDAAVAAIAAGKREGFEHARRTLIEDGAPIPASLVTQGAGDPAFAQTGRACPSRRCKHRLSGNGSAGFHVARSNRHPPGGP